MAADSVVFGQSVMKLCIVLFFLFLRFIVTKAPELCNLKAQVPYDAASVAHWLVFSLSKRKVVGSNPPKVVHTPCRSPRLAPGYLANAR